MKLFLIMYYFNCRQLFSKNYVFHFKRKLRYLQKKVLVLCKPALILTIIRTSKMRAWWRSCVFGSLRLCVYWLQSVCMYLRTCLLWFLAISVRWQRCKMRRVKIECNSSTIDARIFVLLSILSVKLQMDDAV